MDILILNTAVTDFRSTQFDFVQKFCAAGGLSRCETKDMPPYTQQQYRQWIADGCATAGGPGNTAPLQAKAGLDVAVGVHLGKGEFDGLDAQGRFFYDTLTAQGVKMFTQIEPHLPTGTTFVYEKTNKERGGIAYFPNANNAFDFEKFKPVILSEKPKLVYYMYSGLSYNGDADGGRKLADFMAFCRHQGAITIADSHTLTGNPEQVIAAQQALPHYRLLEPLLAQLDLFFCSFDEARMIDNTLGVAGRYNQMPHDQYTPLFLSFLADRFWPKNTTPRLFGITVKDGAFIIYRDAAGAVMPPHKVQSRYMCGQVVDLVGAGDSFRAGLTAYVARNADSFKKSRIDAAQAVQMGNLFASLYVKAPLNDRYQYIGPFEKLLNVVQSGKSFDRFEDLLTAIRRP